MKKTILICLLMMTLGFVYSPAVGAKNPPGMVEKTLNKNNTIQKIFPLQAARLESNSGFAQAPFLNAAFPVVSGQITKHDVVLPYNDIGSLRVSDNYIKAAQYKEELKNAVKPNVLYYCIAFGLIH